MMSTRTVELLEEQLKEKKAELEQTQEELKRLQNTADAYKELAHRQAMECQRLKAELYDYIADRGEILEV